VNRFDAKLKRTNDVLPKPDNLKSYRQPRGKALPSPLLWEKVAEPTGLASGKPEDRLREVG
jgi:hypothetical protein